ncbi:MAG: glycosyltransferase family 2 protein [Muribaculaceae bacterium]|nr:glycosyltransferase family 2 protein [Muribaculaceae bacterium]
MSHRLAIVVPCYNEEAVLRITASELSGILNRMVDEQLIDRDSYVLMVNDGSKDGTWQVIEDLHRSNPLLYKGIDLAHNRGHQNALLAGLMEVINHCDAAISIDADLQDDPLAMIEMVKRWHEGAEIVYGVRSSRETDTWFKRTTAHAFYSFQRSMGVDTVYDHADYRLMSQRALILLSEYREVNLFLRGIVPQIGLTTAIVEYKRGVRAAGESKYPLSKMLSFSIDGITSFSARPMRLIFLTGFTFLLITLLVAVYVFVAYLTGRTIAGWSSLMLSVWFLGSLILMGIGIVGEYIGKIFLEVKARPRYTIRQRLTED